jgi:uncharacterized protein YcbK (DUF882 family)
MEGKMKDIFDRVPFCPHGTIKNMDYILMAAMVRVEKYLDQELVYNSGYRCPECNKLAGGEKNSAHLRGLAVDIKCLTSRARYYIKKAAYAAGFRRIGTGHHIIHLDVDTSLDQDVEWLY